MLHLKSFIRPTLMLLLATACTVKPEPVRYGADSCHFCKMTIVDRTHAAQMVSKKGKQFKYDAIECLVHDLLKQKQEGEMAFITVSDYLRPGEMISAETAGFFISEGIPSPMGGNLSATSSGSEARKMAAENDGIYLNWEQLKRYFAGKPGISPGPERPQSAPWQP